MSLTLAWAPVVLQGDNVLATLGPAKTVGGKHFFKVSTADACLRQLLVGYRSRCKARLADWGLPQKLRELIVAKSTSNTLVESAPVEALFDEQEDAGKQVAKRRRTTKSLLEFVDILCPPTTQWPHHCMWALPIYALKGRAAGSLWIEATPNNIAYLMSAYDEWAEPASPSGLAVVPAALAPIASASAPAADVEAIVADPETQVADDASQAEGEA